MILVRDILSAPLFSGFRMVSGFNGINTPVTQVGFFEWESGADVERNFQKGEFVVTTLSSMKDDPAYAETCLRTLIRHQVSAIAIKDIYFKEVSDFLREFSDTWNVPILFFSDTFIDDILYYIRTALLKEDSAMQERLVRSLLQGPDPTPEQCRAYALKLNPFFEKQLLFCAYITAGDGAQGCGSLDFDTYGNFETRSGQELLALEGREVPPLKYSFLPFGRGVFHICTTADAGAFAGDFPLKFIKSFFPKLGIEYRMGFCTEAGGLESLAGAMKKAFYANISCTVSEISSLDFSETGMDRFLCPACALDGTRGYYEELAAKLTEAGDSPEVLLSTLDTYAECCGDIALTAKLTYQHGNTIRYRLQKVRRAWGIRDALSFDAQIFTFCRMRHIYRLLEDAFGK